MPSQWPWKWWWWKTSTSWSSSPSSACSRTVRNSLNSDRLVSLGFQLCWWSSWWFVFQYSLPWKWRRNATVQTAKRQLLKEFLVPSKSFHFNNKFHLWLLNLPFFLWPVLHFRHFPGKVDTFGQPEVGFFLNFFFYNFLCNMLVCLLQLIATALKGWLWQCAWASVFPFLLCKQRQQMSRCSHQPHELMCLGLSMNHNILGGGVLPNILCRSVSKRFAWTAYFWKNLLMYVNADVHQT